MNATMISRTYTLTDVDIKRVDRQGREVTAYAAVFGQPAEIRDKYGHYFEQIHRSAFSRSISRGIERVQVFYNHGYDLSGKPNMLGAVPIATPVSISPDGTGLLTVSRYNDGELSDAVLAAWEGGQIRGQSFSGRVYQDRELGKRNGVKHVERTELGLKEYGPTHSPAYDGAGLVMIRSQEDLDVLIRSIISDMTGTPVTGSRNDGHAGDGLAEQADTDSPDGHSSSIARQRLALKRKRLLIRSGVNENAETP